MPDVIDPMTLGWSAALLSLERLCYIRVWRSPDVFRAFVRHHWPDDPDAPTRVLARLCLAFKVVQVVVFAAWCLVHGGSLMLRRGLPTWTWVLGAGLIVFGQLLNLSVFRRLGTTGVFYGSRFGVAVPWCDAFPFSWFTHPQYTGVVLSIWGVFLLLRFPAADWIALPLLETAFYGVGARFER